MHHRAISGSIGAFHGQLRWVFALLALLGIVRTLYMLARSAEFGPADRRLALAYSLLLDAQALYGLALFLYLGLDRLKSFDLALDWVDWHPLWMLAAAVVGHKATMGKRLWVQLLVYVVSLALLIIGVLTSPAKGWG